MLDKTGTIRNTMSVKKVIRFASEGCPADAEPTANGQEALEYDGDGQQTKAQGKAGRRYVLIGDKIQWCGI